MLTLLSFEVEFVDFNWTFFSTLSTSTFTSAVLLCFRHNFVSTFYQLCQPRHFKVQFSCVSVTTLFQLSTNFVNFNKKSWFQVELVSTSTELLHNFVNYPTRNELLNCQLHFVTTLWTLTDQNTCTLKNSLLSISISVLNYLTNHMCK